jgi:hypothetical protein
MRGYIDLTMAKVATIVTSNETTDDLVPSRELISLVEKILSHATFDGCTVMTSFSAEQLSLKLLTTWQMYFGNIYQQKDVDKNVSLILEEAEDYMDQIHCFHRFFGISFSVTEQEQARKSFEICSLLGISHSNFKFWTNYVFCQAHKLEMPDWPEVAVKSWMTRNLMVVLHRAGHDLRKLRNQSLLYSFFQGLKKGLLPIRPHHVDESLQKHAKALSREPLPLNDHFKYFCWNKLRNEYSSLIVPKTLEKKKPYMGTLSNKSTVEATRKMGGQVGYLRSYSTNLVKPPEFIGYVEIHKLHYWGDELLTRTVTLNQVYSILPDEDIIDFLLGEKRCGKVSSFVVQPATILEPLKGRIITKPSSGDYMFLTNIQKFLWGKLRKMRSFELVGRPVCVEDIYYISNDWRFGQGFISGDYSGATDNLTSNLSKLIMKFLLQEFNSEYRDSIIRSFCETKIDYSKCPLPEDGKWMDTYIGFESQSEDPVQQRNGQLMGHVLSFIVLCIANKLVFDYSFWRRNKESPRVLVNGDDILFKATQEDYTEWMKDVRSVGFFPSLGKNLYSPDICQINSVLFQIKFCQLDYFTSYIREIRPVPYLNFGIITGRGKGKEDQNARTGIQDSIKAMETVVEEIPVLHSNFQSLHKWGYFWNLEEVKVNFILSRIEGFMNHFQDLNYHQTYRLLEKLISDEDLCQHSVKIHLPEDRYSSYGRFQSVDAEKSLVMYEYERKRNRDPFFILRRDFFDEDQELEVTRWV